MRLYSLHQNSAGWRVRIALHLKGISFNYTPASELGEQRYREINPQGLLPALEIDGAVVGQSTAILELLEERYPEPPLLPDDDIERAEVRAFCQLIACDLHPMNSQRARAYLADPLGLSEREILAWYRHWVSLGLGGLEATLQRRSGRGLFCFGPEPSLADVYLVPQLYNCRRYDCDLTPYPALLAAEQACRDHEAFRAAAPEHLPDYEGQQEPWLVS
ncbi:maleylacetoacetate isomerase/maleylpyruvate isomerase [Tistlia consotensis]|uniref:Maleylacetoacetate isomerase/maleylpyruvate isomerase n=1 Tax=Tistlia consotensis USBA 355 TaxID=560819 RepID=A0A1Y6BAU6_9PROT|nr:maleylacetoacetate isomerase [Tistlia consotensis]SMF01944.1 maleylacetoacetate isomerase/maleylpyruvate isomerase [Tistlia consotensis USBA 355]SNS26033.1 maleylacetoacetate isomerase/maleylpyruvate isomerase [Tistlia consotensis]